MLRAVYGEGAHLKIALSELPAGEHGRTVKLCYGVLENDGYLGLCINQVAEKAPRPAIALAMKLALYATLFAELPRPVAVSEAVSLVKEIGKGGSAGFVNAALRRFDETKVTIPDGIEGLCVRSNFPRFAVERIVEVYGDRAESILLARSKGVSVRFKEHAENYLHFPRLDTPFEQVKIFPRFVRDGGFDRGEYTFQSVGSVAICDVIEPCESLLDACAAPGGKSVLLAEKCKSVTACELHAHRTALIESYCRRMHAENVTVRQADSALFEPAFEGAFDGVLCDVPCSGLGTVSENPDLPLRKNEGGMSELHALQTAILGNCARYVKSGGHLYYSTCSILPEENDGIVGAFLKAHREFVVENARSPLPHERTEYGLQFLPDTAFGAGFYVCKLRKL